MTDYTVKTNINAVHAESSTFQENKTIKKEEAVELADKCLKELAASLEQGQTEGEELPKLSEIRGSAEDHLLYLESVYYTLNIKLETRPMPEGIRGASLGGHVVVKEGLDKTMRFRVLTHELAHEILHSHLVGHDIVKNRTLIETEAEAVAFVVCKAYGIDTRALSSEYIHLHRGDNKLLMSSLDRIQQTATRIIGLIEDDKHAPINIRFSHRSKDRRHVTHQSI